MQTLRKKTSPLKYRNEPARFFGDGVMFKAKLIGILEVGEARGDRMCQEALSDLKVAIRAAGEHKQKITIHVTIEGLRLRDEKTGESLYHHPVHKISFIAQDMTDSRSFGYIFGSPDCGHRFFGIKTDKAASQVVLAMRDLFQCVFELKKKEIELAKQHIQNRITAHEHQQVKISILDQKKTSSNLTGESCKPKAGAKSPETTTNLVNLEQELSSIQRGITQMERITPSEEGPKSFIDDDPFGDSFTSFSSNTFNILPPPTSSKRNQSKQNEELRTEPSLITETFKSSTPPVPPFPSTQQPNDSWLNSSLVITDSEKINYNEDLARPYQSSIDDSNNANLTATRIEIIDAFTDLDPLGTGRSKPYVDKKFFFQDLKNPPKRVLKDLSEQESSFDAHFSPLRLTTSYQEPSLESTVSSSVFDSLKSPDPFEEEAFSKININQLEMTSSVSPKSIILPDTKISSFSEVNSKRDERKLSEASPESRNSASITDPKRLDRQVLDGSSRNVFSVDAFSKKLPKTNLFGQRNVKRDSNGINMRRLQESDSLSENEPELPPRPDIGSHDPPPLPPKNTSQFPTRDNYDQSRFKSTSNVSPPLPLPSRRVNRMETTYSSTSRPSKKSNDDDDNMTSNSTEIPTLLPPPQKRESAKLRGPRKSETDPKNLDAITPPVSAKPEYEIPLSTAPILPDITLSQLLTLGIDDLASKLNVPSTKLNTMTIVELTKYLSEFIESSQQPIASAHQEPSYDSPVFKVSFDDSSDATFVATFDDNFGELDQQDNSFVANFDNFNQPPAIPTEDRYAVFREIIDQDIQSQQHETFHQESLESTTSNSLEEAQESLFEISKAESLDNRFSPEDSRFKQSPRSVQVTKIDTKITDAISGAKDRYAALRDIILVEDLFDKTMKPPLASISDSNLSDDIEDTDQVTFDTHEVVETTSADNVPTYISWVDAEAITLETSSSPHPEEQNIPKINDDYEIDDYMKKTISELSLDQRFSPNILNKSPNPLPQSIAVDDTLNSSGQKLSPLPFQEAEETAINFGDDSKEEKPLEDFVQNDSRDKTITPNDMEPAEPTESWANFDQDTRTKVTRETSTTPTSYAKPMFKEKESPTSYSKPVFKEKESPYSSDGKKDFKQREKEYHRRWPKPHTSSSSRDVSPWDEDTPPTGEFRRRPRPHHHDSHYSSERHVRPSGLRRRINSCDEEFEDDYEKRSAPPRVRVPKPTTHRSKEVLDSDNLNWSYQSDHWSDDENNDRRSFDRNVYERNTYGPPFDKRDLKSISYDRREHRNYDKRSKYFRPSTRNEYGYDSYEIPQHARIKLHKKEIEEYEGNYERNPRDSRNARDYFYERDRKSFDSNESYDSGRGPRSGEVSASFEYRDRYHSHNRSMRRNQRPRDAADDDDSDIEAPVKLKEETGSLTRATAVGRGSKHIQLDDDVWGGRSNDSKLWKRPSSATAGDRVSSDGLSGSDDEKEKRLRRKSRPTKGKEIELRSNYATIRYSHPRKEFYGYEDETVDYSDDLSHRNASPRISESEAYYSRRKQCLPKNRSDVKGSGEYSKPNPTRYADTEELESRRFTPRGSGFKKSTSREIFTEDGKEYYMSGKSNVEGKNEEPRQSNRRSELSLDEQSQTSAISQGSNKQFNFDGFESDFNLSPRQKSQAKSGQAKNFTFETEFSQSPSVLKNGSNQQKLRFNDNVSVSKFDVDSSAQQMFEDDFLEWTPETPASTNIQSSLKKAPGSNLKSNSVFTRNEHIKKSDSVNIFARKSDEDPFENDDFFNDEGKDESGNGCNDQDEFHWSRKNTFANFDDNKNI